MNNMNMVLQTQYLTKKYGAQIAVNNVCLNVKRGDIYGLIGKNGAGKTTIMKMICGLVYPNQGQMQLFESNNLKKGRKRIGCLIEEPGLCYGMTARQNLIYYSKLLGISNYDDTNDILNLVGLEYTGKKKARDFSLGMKQRLSIAISLLGSPDFLILDEPINGLDPSGIKEVRDLILKLNNEKEITVLISSHILSELAKIATKYAIIKDGILIDEFSVTDLESRCKKCIILQVDNPQRAMYIIENNVNSKDYKVFEQGKICIYDCLDQQAYINKELVENGILVSSICLEDEDIEAYFLKLMGGTHDKCNIQ